jgi:hypothetical protein
MCFEFNFCSSIRATVRRGHFVYCWSVIFVSEEFFNREGGNILLLASLDLPGRTPLADAGLCPYCKKKDPKLQESRQKIRKWM